MPRKPKLSQAATPLIGDTRFHKFLSEVEQMRENAILDLCNDAVLENQNKILATIGEIRCYTSVLSLISHLKQNSVDFSNTTDNPEGTA